MYLECNAKGIFAIALLGKKLEFHTEICVYFKFLISKYRIFHRVKELSKSNQTRYGEFHVYVECNAKGISAIAFLGKKLEFYTEICVYFKYLISKCSLFHPVKEFLKSNQTLYGVSHEYLECNVKKFLL